MEGTDIQTPKSVVWSVLIHLQGVGVGTGWNTAVQGPPPYEGLFYEDARHEAP